MTIGDRDIKKVIKALFQKQHYIAFLSMLIIYPNFIDSFKRYFLNKGIYPCKINIRTPLGKINPEIYSYYDMLTVNEIFCRKDYKANKDIKVVVDIGSNIGLSALYFLTRNKYVKSYLYEPVPMNIKRLIKNLGNFIESIIPKIKKRKTRFNKGISGKGKFISKKYKDDIINLAKAWMASCQEMELIGINKDLY